MPGPVARDDARKPHCFATGNSPRGRQSSTADHQRDVRPERELGRQEPGIVRDEPDQHRGGEAARDRAQPADDDDDEDEDRHVRPDRRRHLLLIPRPGDAADAGERRARDEHADEQAADVEAERLHHLAVLDPGAHQQADARAVQHERDRGEEHEPEHHDGDAIGLDRRPGDDDAAAQHRRFRDGERFRAPGRDDELLGDDEPAHRDQDLAQMRAVHPADDDALEQRARRAARNGRDEDRDAECGEVEPEIAAPTPSPTIRPARSPR